MRLSVAGAILLGLALFAGGYLLGGRGSAHLRDAYRDTVQQDRAAARVSDALAAHQRAEDSTRVAEATEAAQRAQGRSQASGRALPGHLPTIPDTIIRLDSAEVAALRDSLKAFNLALQRHLADDSLARDSVRILVATLRQSEADSRATAELARAQRDRVTDQLNGAVRHLKGGHSILVDAAIAIGGFAAGHIF